MGKIGEAWASEADLGQRDPNNLNDHLKITFEEVLGEPDHTHALDCVWRFSYKCFTVWKTLCYLILTTICGIPIATCWGCYFACIAFCHIWQWTPSIAACAINLSMVKKCYALVIGGFLDPCFESCAKLFSPFAK